MLLVEVSCACVGLMRVELKSCGGLILRKIQKHGPDASSLLDWVDVDLLDGIFADGQKADWLFSRDRDPDETLLQERLREEFEIVHRRIFQTGLKFGLDTLSRAAPHSHCGFYV
jgi:hypothetical protein